MMKVENLLNQNENNGGLDLLKYFLKQAKRNGGRQ